GAARDNRQMSLSSQHRPRTRPQRVRSRVVVLIALCSSSLLAAAVAATIVLVTTVGNSRPRPPVTVPVRAAADHGLDVVPFPGTPDAAPSAHILFPALLPSEVRSV